MEEKTIVFKEQIPKKHSVCYKTNDKDAAVQSIYLMRSAFKPNKPPDAIEVVIREIK